MSEEREGWRECADPVELAAAVAARVEVQRNWGYDWQPGTNNETAEQFAGCTKANLRYRVPASWSWSPEPPAPDDLVSRARRHAETHPESRELIEELVAAAPPERTRDGDLRERIARAAAGGYMRVPIVALDGMYLGPPWIDVADAVLAVLPPQPADEGAGPSGPPWYLALDVWMALGGDSNAFEAWAHHEDDRRTWGDAWAQIVAAVGGSRMEGDRNPPPGTILDLPSYQWVRESPAPSPVPPWPDGVLRDAANRLRWIANSGYIEDPGIKRIIRSWADELDATLVPPWPGAVLSGLCDEDGVPTWLAQAGQVRGEQVRRRSDFVWVDNDQMVAHFDTVWVEVRAPRPVAVPETERVQLGVAVVGGLLAICREGGTLDLGRGDVRIHTENGALVASTSESMFTVEIDADGTVEVLKDGDR